MPTEILEGCVEDQKSAEGAVGIDVFPVTSSRKLSPCIRQLFANRTSLDIYDVADPTGKTILRTINRPRVKEPDRQNCYGCLNDEGNFMCKNYTPAVLRTFNVRNTKPDFIKEEDFSDPWWVTNRVGFDSSDKVVYQETVIPTSLPLEAAQALYI